MKKMVLILISVILILIAGYITYSSYITNQFQKYCVDNCEVSHVSRADLNMIKESRSKLAISNITAYQGHINDLKERLSGYVNDEQLSRLEAATVSPEYNPDLEYTVDELIEFETKYKEASDEVDLVQQDYNQLYRKSEISTYVNEIYQAQKDIEQSELSDEEQTQYEELNEQLDDIDYDKTANYNMDQLDGYVKEYRSLAKQYNYLAKYN